jgi:hypothetical protein
MAQDHIIPCIGECLKGSYPADSAFASSSSRTAAVDAIAYYVGSAVYWIRQPEPLGNAAIVLRTVSQVPEYELGQEHIVTQPVIQLDVFTKGHPPYVAAELSNNCRLALSNYRGWLWDADCTEKYIHGITIVREPMDPAQLPVDAGAYWSFVAGFDMTVTHERTVVT